MGAAQIYKRVSEDMMDSLESENATLRAELARSEAHVRNIEPYIKRSAALQVAVRKAMEWAANFPLGGSPSLADTRAAIDVYSACEAALAAEKTTINPQDADSSDMVKS